MISGNFKVAIETKALEIMSKPVLKVRADDSMRQAAALMLEHKGTRHPAAAK